MPEHPGEPTAGRVGFLGDSQHPALGGFRDEGLLALPGERRDEVEVVKVHACNSAKFVDRSVRNPVKESVRGHIGPPAAPARDVQRRPSWNADELADRLEVTTRTLRRDVTRLRDLGYPITSTTGRYGGYELGAGGRLPPLLLDDDEAIAVSVALRDLSGEADPTLGEAALVGVDQAAPGAARAAARSRRRAR